jgi:DnaJ like chaperone protein
MKSRFFWGKIVGPLIGIFAGVFGIILGFVVGVLFDQLIVAIRSRKSIEGFLSAEDISVFDAGKEQKFLAAIGITVSFVHCEGGAYGRWMEPLKNYLRLAGILERDEIRTVLGLIEDESYPVHSINTPELLHTFNSQATQDDASTLIKLLFDMGTAEIRGMSSIKREKVYALAAGLDISREKLLSIESFNRSAVEEASRILGVTPDLSISDIKGVYKKLATQFHPDGANQLDSKQKSLTEEAFKRINWAYNTIIKHY